MDAYIGHAINMLVILAGLVGVYNRLVARLSKLELRLQLDDDRADERKLSRELAVKQLIREYCREECPRVHGTDPRIPIYPQGGAS